MPSKYSLASTTHHLLNTGRAEAVFATLGAAQLIDFHQVARHKRHNDHLAYPRTLRQIHRVAAKVHERCAHLAAKAAVDDPDAVAERDALTARKTRAREQQPNAPTRNLESASEPDDCAGVRLKPAILGDAQVEARISIVCVTRQLCAVEQLHV